MKKSIIGLAALALMVGMTACGNKAENQEETVEGAEVMTEQAEEVTPVADEPSVEPEIAVEEAVEEENPQSATVEKTAKNDTKSDYITTPSGLKYKVIKKGKGKHPKSTDTVKVNYEGKFTNGTVFDSSYQRGEPISFPLNRVIAGWTEGVQLMPEGSVYEFYIPYNLAYGEQGMPPAIPPKSDLIFKVELIEVQ